MVNFVQSFRKLKMASVSVLLFRSSDEEYILLDKDSSEFAFSDASNKHHGKDRKKKYRHCKHERDTDSNVLNKILLSDIRQSDKELKDTKRNKSSTDTDSQILIEKKQSNNYDSDAMKIDEIVDNNGRKLATISNASKSNFKKCEESLKALRRQKENLETSLKQCLLDELEQVERKIEWSTNNKEELDAISISSSGSDTSTPKKLSTSSSRNNDTKNKAVVSMDQRIIIKVNVENKKNRHLVHEGHIEETINEDVSESDEMVWEDESKSTRIDTRVERIKDRFRGRLGEKIQDHQDSLQRSSRKRSKSKSSSRKQKLGQDRRRHGRDRDGKREISQNRKFKKHSKDSLIRDKKIEYEHSDSSSRGSSKSIDIKYKHEVNHERNQKSKKKVQKKSRRLKSNSKRLRRTKSKKSSQSETNSVVSSESSESNSTSSESEKSDMRSYTPPLPCKKFSNDDSEIGIQKLTVNAESK